MTWNLTTVTAAPTVTLAEVPRLDGELRRRACRQNASHCHLDISGIVLARKTHPDPSCASGHGFPHHLHPPRLVHCRQHQARDLAYRVAEVLR